MNPEELVSGLGEDVLVASVPDPLSFRAINSRTFDLLEKADGIPSKAYLFPLCS